jgi:hypothetical protein
VFELCALLRILGGGIGQRMRQQADFTVMREQWNRDAPVLHAGRHSPGQKQ